MGEQYPCHPDPYRIRSASRAHGAANPSWRWSDSGGRPSSSYIAFLHSSLKSDRKWAFCWSVLCLEWLQVHPLFSSFPDKYLNPAEVNGGGSSKGVDDDNDRDARRHDALNSTALFPTTTTTWRQRRQRIYERKYNIVALPSWLHNKERIKYVFFNFSAATLLTILQWFPPVFHRLELVNSTLWKLTWSSTNILGHNPYCKMPVFKHSHFWWYRR